MIIVQMIFSVKKLYFSEKIIIILIIYKNSNIFYKIKLFPWYISIRNNCISLHGFESIFLKIDALKHL
jgi:hypothetical protein